MTEWSRKTMRELRFERLSEDGTHLVLEDSEGDLFELPLEEGLASAVRRGMRRTSTRRGGGDITPRDIQALIRQGLSIDEVCSRTGLDNDFVQRFAEPVMAEMDFVIQRARRLSLYEDEDCIGVDELAERASQRCGLSPEDLQWSCRKTAESTWRIDAVFADSQALSLIFRVNEGTITPADTMTEQLLAGRAQQVVDLTDGSLPMHWDAQHPAAKAAVRQALVSEDLLQDAGDDPSRIF